MLPFLAAREQVSKYDVFVPGYTLPSQYQDACISVMRHASWVVIDRRLDRSQDTQADRSLRCGTLNRRRKNGSSKPWMTASSWSREVAFELRRRREGISDAVCVGMAE